MIKSGISQVARRRRGGCAAGVGLMFLWAALFGQGALAQSRTSQTLLRDLENAKAVLWVGAHPDDEILVSGLLALASLRFNKDTYTISRTHLAFPVGMPPGATVEMRYQDNAEMKEFLMLKQYIRFNSREHPGAGNWREKFHRFVRQFILEHNIDVVVSFEPVAGYNGHPDHKALATAIRPLVRDIAEGDKREIVFYSIINGNTELQWMKEHGPPVEPPHTDLIDRDAERVTGPDGRSMSLWELLHEVLGIYKESVGGAPRIYNNWQAWSAKVRHVELYQRVVWR